MAPHNTDHMMAVAAIHYQKVHGAFAHRQAIPATDTLQGMSVDAITILAKDTANTTLTHRSFSYCHEPCWAKRSPRHKPLKGRGARWRNPDLVQMSHPESQICNLNRRAVYASGFCPTRAVSPALASACTGGATVHRSAAVSPCDLVLQIPEGRT